MNVAPAASMGLLVLGALAFGLGPRGVGAQRYPRVLVLVVGGVGAVLLSPWAVAGGRPGRFGLASLVGFVLILAVGLAHAGARSLSRRAGRRDSEPPQA